MLNSILSPMILAFSLGIIAARLKSDLKFPDSMYTALTIYLIAAIGFKEGYNLSITSLEEVYLPVIKGIALLCLIPLWTFAIMRKFGKLSYSLSRHYLSF